MVTKESLVKSMCSFKGTSSALFNFFNSFTMFLDHLSLILNFDIAILLALFSKFELSKTSWTNPLALESSMIDKTIIDKEQELVTEELKNSGKPVEIAKKISLGKMNKFKEENALLTQAWVMEPKKKVQDVLKELAINDLKIKEFSRIKIGE